MPNTIVTIPDFDFAAYYYPQILEALIAYKRRNVPELTDESAYEPYTQMMRMIALVGHLNNVLLDVVANESTLITAKLAESVRNHLRLIDYEMNPASPASVDVVYELSKVFTAQFELISADAQAATQRSGTDPVIYFEALERLLIDRTDEHSYVFAEEDGVFVDYTSDANSDSPTDDFDPWVSPGVKDAIYWGHAHVMWDTLSVLMTAYGSNFEGIWEYFDGDWSDVSPTSVTDIGGGQLEIDLTSLLGSENRQGTQVKVQYNPTTAYEVVEAEWDGSKNKATSGLLGQTSPSTDVVNYSIGVQWKQVEIEDNEVGDFTANGDLEYLLPQTLLQNWRTTEVNGVTAYWLRYRIITISTPVSPTIRRTRMDGGKQYALRSCTQGQSHLDSPLGSSTGLANQRFPLSKEYFVSESEEVSVDGTLWTRVENFLGSVATDRHYTIELGENDRATVVFGDGVNGRIPPLGVGNISADYRWGANYDGNVGANTVVVDKTGLTFINKLWNPRLGTGWSEAQGANEASLERAKIEGPASLRTKDVALGPADVEVLALAWTDEDGSSPFGRAKSFEEGYGPKTIELVLVAKGGGAATSSQIDSITEYFNGNQLVHPPKTKHLVANQEVVAVNYTPKLIDIVATVYGDVDQTAISTQLSQVLQPDALKEDGVTYEWQFGGDVPLSRINHEIFASVDGITKVEISSPAADVVLASRELPKANTISITVVTP